MPWSMSRARPKSPLGVEGLVQHDVARLDVAMDDALVPLLVEVQHGGRQSKNYLVSENSKLG